MSNWVALGDVSKFPLVEAVRGIAEKITCVRRNGIRRVILSARNELDVLSMPPDAKEGLNIMYVSTVYQAINENCEKFKINCNQTKYSENKLRRKN